MFKTVRDEGMGKGVEGIAVGLGKGDDGLLLSLAQPCLGLCQQRLPYIARPRG